MIFLGKNLVIGLVKMAGRQVGGQLPKGTLIVWIMSPTLLKNGRFRFADHLYIYQRCEWCLNFDF